MADKDVNLVVKESEKQLIQMALKTERERLKRSLQKEVSGSQIHLLRQGEIAALDRLIVQVF